MKNKLLTLFLALAVSVGTLFAQSGTCGDNLTWTLNNGTLTISGTGVMYNFEYPNYAPWYSSRSSIKTVIIEDGVTSIGNYAFYWCESLTSITIPNSVTSIGDGAFLGCSSLTSVTIPNSVTSIGDGAFGSCISLTSVTIPNSVTSIGEWAFYYCSSLTSVTIPNSVTSIGNDAFSGCSSLTSVTIPNSVTSIGDGAFRDCSSLTSITIPNSVTSIGNYAFYNCSGLTALTIPNSVTSIGDEAFYNCSSLTSATIGNSVKSIGKQAFYGCTSFTSITIPNSVTSIGEWAFRGCSGLTSVTINSNRIVSKSYSGSTTLVAAFGNQVQQYVIGNGVTSIGESAFSGCSGLTSVTIGNSVTSIENNAFRDCKISKIYFSGTMEEWCTKSFSPGSISSSYTLYINDVAVTNAVIPNSVTSIGNYAFSNCSGLTSVTIGESVTSIGNYAFSNCSGLTSVTIGESVTSIGDYAFYQCSKLTSVTIPNSVTSIGNGAFESCSSLTSVTIPNSVTSIGNSAFGYCSSLTSVTIPNSVTSIGDYAFYSCSSLTSVTIPNSVTSIGSYAFPANAVQEIHFTGTMEEWFTKSFNPNRISSSYTLFINGEPITNLVIPNSVTSIGEDAFWDCSSLKNVSIASSVKVLEGSAFYNCSNIETITCYGMRPPTVNTNALYGLSYSTIVYVPADYLETYQMHEQWGLYDVRALENSGTEPATYTITWQDEDGNVIKTDEVKQGTTPAFTGTTPTKPATNEYTYEFAGWLPKIKAATEDAKYTTFFERNKIETPVYTVNINGENCSLNINNQYPEGTVITLEAVADECFEFQQWSDGNKDNPRTITITANTNLTAEFNKVRYTVTGEPSTGGKVQIRKQ